MQVLPGGFDSGATMTVYVPLKQNAFIGGKPVKALDAAYAAVTPPGNFSPEFLIVGPPYNCDCAAADAADFSLLAAEHKYQRPEF